MSGVRFSLAPLEFTNRLPSLPERRLAIRVSADALRQIRGGHPWVWADAIRSVSDESAGAGTLAVIFDQKRKFAAIGLWDPASPIRVRILHAGTPTTIDTTFWHERIREAIARRDLLRASETTAWRVVNGENDGMGGCIVDRYADTIVVKIYSEAWLPHLASVTTTLVQQLDAQRLVLRLGRLAATSPGFVDRDLVDGMVLHGTEPDGPIPFRENGLRFDADVISGQKTGHFLDQRDNRLLLRERSAEAEVLDVFCCTGGFSVNAAAGGARSVHSVDLSRHAIAAVQRNLAANAEVTARTRARSTVGDAFEVMAALAEEGERYDIVVIDPPSFASRARERDPAIRAYRKLTELGLPLLRRGGLLLQASCSSRVDEDDLVRTIEAAVRGQGRQLSDPRVTGHAIDHPVTFPEGRYLKAVVATVD